MKSVVKMMDQMGREQEIRTAKKLEAEKLREEQFRENMKKLEDE